MKTLLCLVALLTASLAAAADKPDFSGDWKMNIEKSSFGPVPPPTSYTRKVTHQEPSVTIADEQKGGTGDQSVSHTYTTDGKQVSYQMNGADVKAAASWDGDALVVRSNVDAGGIAISIAEKMTLSEGNHKLTDTIKLATPMGDLDLIYIFEKP